MTLVMHLCSPCNRRTIIFYDDDHDDDDNIAVNMATLPDLLSSYHDYDYDYYYDYY